MFVLSEKPNLLFLGHEFHLKTKSADFMIHILQQQFNVERFYFNPQKIDEKFCCAQLSSNSFDTVIVWQLMPSINELKKYISFKHLVFFPMYDEYAAGGGICNKLWLEYKNAHVICFCKKMANELMNAGFTTKYIQYFLKPLPIKDWGNPHKIFFWQRSDDVTIHTLLSVVKNMDIQAIHFHRATDPHTTITEPPPEWQDKITSSTWFDTKEEMIACQASAAFYFAPRKYEGIGMSLLEAMASGRCVIAPNEATANEYIQHGVTGYLYDLNNPQPITISDLSTIEQNAYHYISAGYQKWEQEKDLIFEWIQQPVSFDKTKWRQALKEAKKLKYTQRQKTKIPFVYYDKQRKKESYYFGRLLIWRIRKNKKKNRKIYTVLGIIPVYITHGDIV